MNQQKKLARLIKKRDKFLHADVDRIIRKFEGGQK